MDVAKMKGLQNISAYEAQIMQILCSNTTIQKLLDNKTDNYNPKDIKWKNIRPDTYIPDTTANADNYITYTISGKAVDSTTELLLIDFYIFSHKSLLRTDQGKRTTLIASAIDSEFNGTNRIGLGKMKLVGFDGNFAVGKDYHGYKVTYAFSSYNSSSGRSGAVYAK